MAGVRVSVDFDGLAEVRALVERAERAVQPPQITDAALAAAKVYQAGARARAPKRSGRLAASIETRTVGGYSAQARTDLIYAQITEFGGVHRPHSAKVLRFDPGGGAVFRPRSYNPAQPYWIPTFDQDTGLAVDAFTDTVMAHIGA